MSQETTYTGWVGEWQKLIASLEANVAELPHTEVPRKELAAMLARSQEIALEQAALTATKQDKSQQLKVVMTEGQRLANVLRAIIRQRYGIRSEKLAEFSLQPFRGRNRTSKAKKAQQQETPAPAPPASSNS
jgi:hypothetical protein